MLSFHEEVDIADMNPIKQPEYMFQLSQASIIDKLPSEILDSIIDIIPPTREGLEPISLVSKAFTSHCQRRLLASISLWAKLLDTPHPLPGKKLLNLLEQSPHIGSYMSAVTIYFTHCGNPAHVFTEQDFWVYQDAHLVPALQKLAAVRHLTLAHLSHDGTWVPETMGPIIRDILVALKADQHLTVLDSSGMPPMHLYHALTMAPNIKHLLYTPKQFLPSSDLQGIVSVPSGRTSSEQLLNHYAEPDFNRVKLTSLAICDRISWSPEVKLGEMLPPSRPADDISFVHNLDLSSLKTLCFGCETIGSGAAQGYLARILSQCQDSLEELRAAPSFRNGETALAYLQSHYPRLVEFPFLRVIETCLDACEDVLRVSNDNTSLEMYNGSQIMQLFADSFLASASPTNNLEHIRLFIRFDGFAFPSRFIPEWRAEYDPDRTEEIMGRIKAQFTPEYGRLLGLHHIDRVLTAVDGKFERLKKLTIIAGPHRPFLLCDRDALLDAYRALFAEWELTRRGQLEVVLQKNHRLIEDVSDWIRPNM